MRAQGATSWVIPGQKQGGYGGPGPGLGSNFKTGTCGLRDSIIEFNLGI